MTITAAADGSALGNPGPAGWAWYIDEDTWRAGGWPHGTNNMGELKAVLDLLEATAADADQHLHILCDSQYVINSVTQWMPGWKRKGWRKKDGKPVLNVDLLKAIDAALVGRSVEFEWVKGHAGHAMNEAADRRANAAATAFSRHRDPDVGPGYRPTGAARGTATADAASAAGPATAASGPRPDAPGAGSGAGPSAGAGASAEDLFWHADQAEAARAGSTGPAPTSPRPAAAARPSGEGPDDAPALTVFEDVIAREEALLGDRLRADPERAARLLHPAFTEVGASGRTYDRDRILRVLAPLDGVVASDFVADRVAPEVVLLRFRTRDAEGRTVQRTSLWVREGGQWLLRHHQGTPAAR